ncbi:hypothetical protein BBJ28_00019030 [Nothophytophthora sp. Chile5]|nr:hypothetical protein BBJ28_00019030 [Nothophytophthora sp. Chile5]
MFVALSGAPYQAFKTGVMSQPEWNSKYEIRVHDPTKAVLTVLVKSQQMFYCPIVGSCVVDLKHLIGKGDVDQWFPLRKGQFQSGHIRLQLLLQEIERPAVSGPAHGLPESQANCPPSVMRVPVPAPAAVPLQRQQDNDIRMQPSQAKANPKVESDEYEQRQKEEKRRRHQQEELERMKRLHRENEERKRLEAEKERQQLEKLQAREIPVDLGPEAIVYDVDRVRPSEKDVCVKTLIYDVDQVRVSDADDKRLAVAQLCTQKAYSDRSISVHSSNSHASGKRDGGDQQAHRAVADDTRRTFEDDLYGPLPVPQPSLRQQTERWRARDRSHGSAKFSITSSATESVSDVRSLAESVGDDCSTSSSRSNQTAELGTKKMSPSDSKVKVDEQEDKRFAPDRSASLQRKAEKPQLVESDEESSTSSDSEASSHRRRGQKERHGKSRSRHRLSSKKKEASLKSLELEAKPKVVKKKKSKYVESESESDFSSSADSHKHRRRHSHKKKHAHRHRHSKHSRQAPAYNKVGYAGPAYVSPPIEVIPPQPNPNNNNAAAGKLCVAATKIASIALLGADFSKVVAPSIMKAFSNSNQVADTGAALIENVDIGGAVADLAGDAGDFGGDFGGDF